MKKAIRGGIPPGELFDLPLKEEITRMRYIPEAELGSIESIKDDVTSQVKDVVESEQTA
jgi:hypothetical protein